MKYSTFEELPVWNAAIEFALRCLNSQADQIFEVLVTQRISLNAPRYRSQTILRKALSVEQQWSLFNFFISPEVLPVSAVRCCEFVSESKDFQISNLKFQI